MAHFQESKPPVAEGDEIDVYVQSVGEKGDGVAKVNGFVVIIPDTAKGDSAHVRITKVLTNVAFAQKIGEAKNPNRLQKPPTYNTKKKDPFDEVDLDAVGEGSEEFGAGADDEEDSEEF